MSPHLEDLEDAALEYFRQNNFTIREWPILHPALEWRPRTTVSRRRRGRTSEAAIVVRENASSYEQRHNWGPLVEARKQLPDVPIYFAIPEEEHPEPLRTELQRLGVGLYLISSDNELRRVQEAAVPFDDQVISYPIHPERPYRNRMNLYKAFANCNDYLWWVDKHFIWRGFELLSDYCNQAGRPPLQEIRILGTVRVSDREMRRLRREFPDVRQELAQLGISVEMRVLDDQTLLASFHDRYLISRDIAFNLPPVGSLLRGQAGSICLDDNPLDFQNLWSHATPL